MLVARKVKIIYTNRCLTHGLVQGLTNSTLNIAESMQLIRETKSKEVLTIVTIYSTICQPDHNSQTIEIVMLWLKTKNSW